ncbi:phospholipid phosphatase 5-like isoform X1 [Acropora millepora]|uniref:phospholipid phosphatase 5-like isoform X1 n=1 Tax=Acropora millepora TaxID=45264 RepID=UPI001CF21953|nr:phospholipid phosphatase 5-like isoform X1 [Acropora millepora]
MAVSILWTLALSLAQIGFTLVLYYFYCYLEDTPALTAERVIHDEEMSLYINPKSEDIISLTMFWVISLKVPAAIIFIIIIVELFRRHTIDDVHAFFGFFLTLALNGVITNMIKVLVGRPRPDYFWRCYPNGTIPLSSKCDGNPDEIIQGIKSFPSGHSSFAFSGLGFLSLYLRGKLHCFQTQGRSQGCWKCLSLVPVALFAPFVAFTRYLDNSHHWEDIVAGSMLGFSLSYVYHRSILKT